MSGSCPEFARYVEAERFEWHEGGHSIPSWGNYPDFLANYILTISKEAKGLISKEKAKHLRYNFSLLIRAIRICKRKRVDYEIIRLQKKRLYSHSPLLFFTSSTRFISSFSCFSQHSTKYCIHCFKLIHQYIFSHLTFIRSNASSVMGK